MTKKCEYLNDANNNQSPCLASKDEDCPKNRLKRRVGQRCWNMKPDSAVSPVVGTLLLLAIMAILAVVVANYAIGMAGEQKPSHTSGFSVDRTTNGDIRVQYSTNGGSVMDVPKIDIYIGDSMHTIANPKVGESWTYAAPKQTRVLVYVWYGDGTNYPAMERTV